MLPFSRLKKKRLDKAFLILGLLLTSTLALVKQKEKTAYQERVQSLQAMLSPQETIHLSPLEIPNKKIKIGSHKCLISLNTITAAQFHQFCQLSGYQTWRERHHSWPNWEHPLAVDEPSEYEPPSWETAPSTPAVWLVREDAEAFCLWLSRQNGSKHSTCRLPSVEELQVISETMKAQPQREWTMNNLSDFDSSFEGGANYHTAWKAQAPLTHRRLADLGRADSEPVGFRVAWE
jgi:formylglycine-generating enzyme required for sulfatase activity